LLSVFVRPVVIALFTALLFGSIAVIPKIDVGLDQELALPKVSEIKKNFNYTMIQKIINKNLCM